jgi:hypothetical protein
LQAPQKIKSKLYKQSTKKPYNMKKLIITVAAAIVLTTGAIATSGIKFIKHQDQKVQTTSIANNLNSDKEIASAD